MLLSNTENVVQLLAVSACLAVVVQLTLSFVISPCFRLLRSVLFSLFFSSLFLFILSCSTLGVLYVEHSRRGWVQSLGSWESTWAHPTFLASGLDAASEAIRVALNITV